MRYWMVKLCVWTTTAALSLISYCSAAVHLGKSSPSRATPLLTPVFWLPDSISIRTSYCCKCDFMASTEKTFYYRDATNP